MIKAYPETFILRVAVSVILLMHSLPSLFSNGVYEFGKYYLDEVGFAPVGVALAWAIKLSHVGAAACILFNKYLKWAVSITIVILIAGIIMIHAKDGWYVVGFGRNGVEFNFLLIACLLTILFPKGILKKSI